MADYKLSYSGKQLDNAVGQLVNNGASSGQALIANGTGTAQWSGVKTINGDSIFGTGNFIFLTTSDEALK